MLRPIVTSAVHLVLLVTFAYPDYGFCYEKATDDTEVVKRKLFPKRRKVELNGPNFGFILNQSYIESTLFHGGLTYYPSESWGFGIEVAMSSNSDKFERRCIESFANKFEEDTLKDCVGDGSPDEVFTANNKEANMGPAYVPIREIQQIFAATATWNPIYGKQLFFMSATGHFDVYATMGAGVTISKFYPMATTFADGVTPLRGPLPLEGSGDPKPGKPPSEVESWGELGRPPPENQTTPMFTLGLGQKFHVFKRASFKIEIRNFTLLGTESGFETFFAVWGGLGFRF